MSRFSWSGLSRSARLALLTAIICLILEFQALAETFLESRYQYYQEEGARIEVDSSYSLFNLDLNDTTQIDGSGLYSAISGASPSGLPPLTKGGSVPVVGLTDQRFGFSLGLTKQIANQSIRAGFALSDESDYVSYSYSLVDTISLNHKMTDLVFGLAYTDDIVGENGTLLRASKRSYDLLLGINQVLGPDDLLSLNVALGWREGYLADPYKRVLLNGLVAPDVRPEHRFDQLYTLQWTHYLNALHSSVETSYRFGNNDFGSQSHTVELAYFQKLFGDHLVVRPAFRYYRQSAADFYDTQFTGTPRYYSSDYRLSEEETFSFSGQIRWFAVKDRLAVDVGYERYLTQGLDNKTSQSAYPDANSFTVGLHVTY
jgi:hypothetical protein